MCWHMLAPVPNLVPVSVPVMGLCCGKTLTQKRFGLEARVGIEPTNAAFAEPCLTTWLPRHSEEPQHNIQSVPTRKPRIPAWRAGRFRQRKLE